MLDVRSELEERGMTWDGLDETEKDWFLAEHLLDAHDEGKTRHDFGVMLSAVAKIDPRLKLKVAWKVFDAWAVEDPPRQAPAAPPELITGMMMAAFAIGRPQLAMLVCLCYCGLLRVSEALALSWEDVFLTSSGVVLCLGITKRGMEQKVLLTNATVRAWTQLYFVRFAPLSRKEKFFSLTYGAVLRWVKRLAALLGAESLGLTTHTFRRSGASELSRSGIPLADILLFGRWATERSAREYIRRGEVAIHRARGFLAADALRRLSRWEKLSTIAWQIHIAFEFTKDIPFNRVTHEVFVKIEAFVFETFKV